MKKYFYFLVLIILFFGNVLQAQDAKKDDIIISGRSVATFHGIIGIRYMPSVSSIKIQNAEGNISGDFVLGHGFGGLIGFNFNKHFGTQLELIYNQLSQKYTDHNLDRRIDINYVNIPLLFSLNTNRMKVVNLNLVVGPQLGINVGSKLKTTGTSNGNINTQAVLAVKKNDFGIAYGAGLDFGLNTMRTIRLDIGFRGVMGLVDISDRSGTLETNSYYILRKEHIETYSGYIGLTFLF